MIQLMRMHITKCPKKNSWMKFGETAVDIEECLRSDEHGRIKMSKIEMEIAQ